ncbi:MAG TPA: PLP-dependent aminotransferase family protein [Geothrix sp.]|nr:PLP-dependent aminotransferase family protein [Geothrix sp.]
MRLGELNVFLDPASRGPLYIRVAEAVVSSIRRGHAPRGQVLPGIRDLAAQLGVHRNTVLAAMRELEAQGWVGARPRSGFFVAEALPEASTAQAQGRVSEAPGSLGFDVPNHLRPITDARDLFMDFSDGVADARLAPTEGLARAYQRALRLKGVELLQSADFKGQPRLRQALAEHLAQKRALNFDPSRLLILRSTSMAVSLVAQVLIGSERGHVGVENPGHPAVWETLKQASSAVLHPLRVDEGGVCVEDLENLLRVQKLQILVLTPQSHYPTGVPLAPERRKRLLELAGIHRFAILELDTEFDLLRGDPAARRPLAASDETGQVMYVGSLARVFAPGLRLGYLVVPSPLADRFARARQRLDFQGDALLEWAFSELMLEGEYFRHLRRVRKACLERKEALMDGLRHSLNHRVSFEADHGAMALWIRGRGEWADPTRFDLWIRACARKGLRFRAGSHFDFEGRPLAATRLGFTAYQPEELQQAVALFT